MIPYDRDGKVNFMGAIRTPQTKIMAIVWAPELDT